MEGHLCVTCKHKGVCRYLHDLQAIAESSTVPEEVRIIWDPAEFEEGMGHVYVGVFNCGHHEVDPE